MFEPNNLGFRRIDVESARGPSGIHSARRPTVRHQLQSSRRWLERSFPSIGSSNVDLTAVDSITAGGEDRIEVDATKCQVRDPAIRCGDDTVDSACLIADLQTAPLSSAVSGTWR